MSPVGPSDRLQFCATFQHMLQKLLLHCATARCVATVCFSVCVHPEMLEHMCERCVRIDFKCCRQQRKQKVAWELVEQTHGYCIFSLGETTCQLWNVDAKTNVSTNCFYCWKKTKIVASVRHINLTCLACLCETVGAQFTGCVVALLTICCVFWQFCSLGVVLHLL